MTEIQGKSILVRVSARLEVARVRVIGSRLYLISPNLSLFFFLGQRFAFLEEKIVLYHVMRNFSIESAQTFDDLRTCGELITRPKEGIFVTLAKRF